MLYKLLFRKPTKQKVMEAPANLRVRAIYIYKHNLVFKKYYLGNSKYV